MSDQGADRIREHSFDGIQEYDNRLPNWWLFILYASIVFSLGYWLVFHTFGLVPNPVGRYREVMAAAAEAQLARMSEGGPTNESLGLMATIPARVDEGRELFQQYCVVCHLERGQGSVGPNLTDRYWIHGGAPLDIHRTVTDGVPSKGMAAWGRQLGPRRVEAVVAYVLTLRDTRVEGKAPEGEIWTPAAAADTTSSSAAQSPASDGQDPADAPPGGEAPGGDAPGD
jgi:cytochrome c oxidase cbb3-type subunit 3